METEKALILSVQEKKAEVEKLRLEAEGLERQADFGKVAAIRYGQIPSIEKEIETLKQDLTAAQKDMRLMKVEVNSEEIAEIVAKWTGIPVTRMVER